MKEKTPEKVESVESSQKPEDVIVADMRSYIREIENGNGEGNGTERFHSEIERSYSAELYEKYDTGEIPNLEILELSANSAAEAIAKEIQESKEQGMSDADLTEETKIEKLLQGRPKIITSNIRSYIATVMRFQELAKMRTTGRDLAKQFEQADHQRRRVHNALIESLETFTNIIEDAKTLGLLSEISVAQWRHSEDLRLQESRVVVFSKQILEDRDYIRDWAIVAEMHERLTEIEKLEKK